MRDRTARSRRPAGAPAGLGLSARPVGLSASISCIPDTAGRNRVFQSSEHRARSTRGRRRCSSRAFPALWSGGMDRASAWRRPSDVFGSGRCQPGLIRSTRQDFSTFTKG